VPAKWLVLLAVAPITLLFGLLTGLFHHLVWQLWKFDSLTGSRCWDPPFSTSAVCSGSNPLNESSFWQ